MKIGLLAQIVVVTQIKGLHDLLQILATMLIKY